MHSIEKAIWNTGLGGGGTIHGGIPLGQIAVAESGQDISSNNNYSSNNYISIN
jgi:hypothetical protein